MDIITFPPGVVNLASKVRKTGSWREVNLVRWEEGNMRPIGGWERTTLSGFASTIRAIHQWVDNGGIEHTAYLCEEHLYVESGGTLTDITPVDGITAPPNDQGGYGDHTFSYDSYGTARPGQNRLRTYSPVYTLGNWGEELRAMTSNDGRLLKWAPGDANAEAVLNAPTGNRSFTITPERFIILEDAGGVFGKLQWCDQEDDTEWTPGTTTKAGSKQIEPKSPIVAHSRLGDANVWFTLQGLYTSDYIGLPYIFNLVKRGDSNVPLSPAMVVPLFDRLVWMTNTGFWEYNGASVEKVFCPIWDWIRNNINFRRTIFVGSSVNYQAKSEAWFLFASSADGLPDRAAILSLADNTWSMARLTRTCGYSGSNKDNPLMSDGANVYKHEVGFTYQDHSELPWAESFSLNSRGGERLVTLFQLFPEIAGEVDALQFRVYKSDSRSKNRTETLSAAKSVKSNGYVDIREKARDHRLRIEAIEGADWSIGDIGVDMREGGKK